MCIKKIPNRVFHLAACVIVRIVENQDLNWWRARNQLPWLIKVGIFRPRVVENVQQPRRDRTLVSDPPQSLVFCSARQRTANIILQNWHIKRCEDVETACRRQSIRDVPSSCVTSTKIHINSRKGLRQVYLAYKISFFGALDESRFKKSRVRNSTK